ncbi:hypothetical protein IE53DRAFT_210622 [Violaceomyces palustris]|uniref:Uncharacterized protein n=1 Tax=Violaceomyces palustris TaxID=1673888 RepID=A0ACD0NQR4_9BASI|nr:hypothetical protein IE53DRAFT_210622 [Violaceomyces palustris]
MHSNNQSTSHARSFLESIASAATNSKLSRQPPPVNSSNQSLSSSPHLVTPSFRPLRPSSLSSSASTSASDDGADTDYLTQSKSLSHLVNSGDEDEGQQQRQKQQKQEGEAGHNDGNRTVGAAAVPQTIYLSSNTVDPNGNVGVQSLPLNQPRFQFRTRTESSALVPHDPVEKILSLLQNPDLTEEDQMDKIRSTFEAWLSSAEGGPIPSSRLDSLVLDLMHRHREDSNPTGATFAPNLAAQSPAKRQASVRPFSSSRPWTPTKNTLNSSNPQNQGPASLLDGSPSAPHQGSPSFIPSALPSASLVSGSPRPHPGTIGSGSPRASPRLWNRSISNLSSNSLPSVGANVAGGSMGSPISSVPPGLVSEASRPASPSPLSSPRLNVAATEFRPRNISSSSLNASNLTPTRTIRTEPPWLVRQPSSNSSSTNLALANKSHAGAGEDDEDEFSPFGSSTRDRKPGFGGVGGGGGGESDVSWYSSSTSATSSSGGWDPSPLSTALGGGFGSFPGSMTSTDAEEDDLGYGPTGLTPFDLLYSILVSGTTTGTAQWSPEQVEMALASNGYDVERTLASIWENGGKPLSISSSVSDGPASTGSIPNSPQPIHAIPTATIKAGVNILSRDTFPVNVTRGNGRLVIGHGPESNISAGGSETPPYGPGSMMTQQQQGGLAAVGPGGSRVCRYFLSGECKRSDCKFSHDLGRAVCRYWLKGQCAHNPCNFLHDYDALNALASGIAGGVSIVGGENPAIDEDTHQAAGEQERGDDFPELGINAPPTGPKAQLQFRKGGGSAPVDPSRNRWSAAVQRKAPIALSMQREEQKLIPLHSRATPFRAPPSGPRGSSAAGGGGLNQAASTPASRTSSRLALRAPTLLPTLLTGKASSQTYANHRGSALSLADQRNRLLGRASEAWKKGDGLSAKKFSSEAWELNRRFEEESRTAARKLVMERMEEMRKRLGDADSGSCRFNLSEEPGCRGMRGRIVGNGLGLCLGVSRAEKTGGGGGVNFPLSPEERTESLLDLHGLHSGEAVELVEDFLLGLERENVRGLAYLAVGAGKHSSAATNQRRIKLAGHVKTFLASWGYPFAEYEGLIVCDPCCHF